MARENTAAGAVTVTPSDATTLEPTFGLYVGAAGDVTVDMRDSGKNVPYKAVAAGTFLPIQVTRVYQTGTTASDILALY